MICDVWVCNAARRFPAWCVSQLLIASDTQASISQLFLQRSSRATASTVANDVCESIEKGMFLMRLVFQSSALHFLLFVVFKKHVSRPHPYLIFQSINPFSFSFIRTSLLTASQQWFLLHLHAVFHSNKHRWIRIRYVFPSHSFMRPTVVMSPRILYPGRFQSPSRDPFRSCENRHEPDIPSHNHMVTALHLFPPSSPMSPELSLCLVLYIPIIYITLLHTPSLSLSPSAMVLSPLLTLPLSLSFISLYLSSFPFPSPSLPPYQSLSVFVPLPLAVPISIPFLVPLPLIIP